MSLLDLNSNCKSVLFIFWVGLALLFLDGCRPTHNQKVIPQSWRSYFDAKPQITDPVQSNSKHEILIAVIDSGVDYNHPLIKDHIHYQLDEHYQPIAAGWDFVGDDAWPLPYLARTRSLYQSKDKNTQNEEKQIAATIAETLKLKPAMARWLHPKRNPEDEATLSIHHGTHVAGLASYDDERIGILPYRILPDQETTDNKAHDMLETFYVELQGAIEKAQQSGAKVVNLSVGISFGESDSGAQRMIEIFHKFEALVARYPQLIFVGAAGNENTWVNGQTRFSFPCGVQSPNMVCVASVNKKGIPSEFTNIPLTATPLLFAPGENILAPIPTQFCPSELMSRFSSSMKTAEIESTTQDVLKECPVNEAAPLDSLSGTSMAAPIIARVMAQEAMKFPHSTRAEEIIKSFLKNSIATQWGPLQVSTYRIPIPSWYPKGKDKESLGLRPNSLRRGYFEFYLKP